MFHLLPKKLFFLPSRSSFSSSASSHIRFPVREFSSSSSPKQPFYSAKTFLWPSSSMLKGGDVTGKHFNDPPDAPFNLCYGRFKITLGNPFFPVPELSSSSSPKQRPGGMRIKKDEYEYKVLVLWDFETCGVPSGVSYSKVAPSITGALRTKGFKGPIHIQAYGNVYQLSDINQQILSSTGVDLHHVPGGKTNSHRFLVDGISRHRHSRSLLFLISGDRDSNFVITLNRLSFSNCIILFACPGKVDPNIYHASTIMWQWSKILKGKFADVHNDF